MKFDPQRYAFVAAALSGDGGFIPTVTRDATGKAISVSQTHLVAYPRESEPKFARRNEIAWYENHLLPACQRFVGYLTKKPPLRELPAPLLEAFADDCNWRGDALDVFWQGFMLQAKARGCMLLLIDMPRTLPDNAADQQAQRAFPYLVPIAPEFVVNYQINARGKLTRIEYSGTNDAGDRLIYGWDVNRWWVRDGDQIIDGDDHGLGLCPVLYLSESGDFPFYGPFSQIAEMSKRLFNARSELDEILRSQTFSLLTYHVPPEQATPFDAKSVAETIGTHNMLVHHGAMPEFIAPPDGPAKTYLEEIAHIEQTIARVSLAIELPDQQSAESGLALTIRFQSLNAALTSFARRMEDCERNVWMVVSAWLGLNAEATVEWAKDYALSDLNAEMTTLANMIATGMPVEVVRQQQKTIAQLAFPALENEAMEAMLTAIDNSATEITPSENDPNTALTVTDQQPVDLSPVLDRLTAMEAAMNACPDPAPQLQPIINVTVPEQAAPIVNIAPAAITVEAPVVNVTLPETTPQAAPNVTLNTGTGGRVISLVRDGNGSITGATVGSGE